MVLYIITGSVNTPHKVRRECLHVHKQDGQIKHVVYVLFTAYCKVGKECSVHLKKRVQLKSFDKKSLQDR